MTARLLACKLSGWGRHSLTFGNKSLYWRNMTGCLAEEGAIHDFTFDHISFKGPRICRWRDREADGGTGLELRSYPPSEPKHVP